MSKNLNPESKADFIITGDEDLLILKEWEGAKILDLPTINIIKYHIGI
jgi:predicted nucleic acid-binding protein